MVDDVLFGGDLNVLRTKHNGSFLSYQLNGKRKIDIAKLAVGKSIVHLHNDQLKKLDCYFPQTVEEENKIVALLDALDEKINTQNKIIEDLFLLKKSITHNVFNNSSSEKIKLCNLIDISTGKRDANESDEHGIYPFFTCGKETLKINKYSFEGESLLISGNGEIGQVKYYSGKFDAYQRTYVLQNSKRPILYLKAYLEFILPMIVEREKQQSAMPYIVLGTLKNIDVPILDINKTNSIISTFKAIDKKIERENKYKELLNKEKRYLLSNLFI